MNFLQTIIELSARVTGTANIKGLSSNLKDVQNQASAVSKSFNGVRNAIGAVVSVLAIREIALYGKSIIDLADSLDDLSEKTGITVEALSGIARVASVEGIEVENLGASFVKLANKIEDARGGSDSAIRLFKSLGISLNDANGSAVSTDKIFLQIAERFKNTADGAGKSALAVDLFGKSGASLIPVLNKGSEELKKFSGSISTEFAKNSAEFNDTLKRLGNTIKADLSNQLPGVVKDLNSLLNTFQNLTGSGTLFERLTGVITGTLRILIRTVDYAVVSIDLMATRFKLFGVVFDSVFNLKGIDARFEIFRKGIDSIGIATDRNISKLKTFFVGGEEFGPKPPPGFGDPRKNPPPNNDKRSDIETRMEREANAIAKLKQEITGLKNTRELDQKAIELTTFEYDKLKIEIEEKNKAEKESVNFTKENKKQYMELTDEVIRLKKEFIDLKQAQSESFSFGAKEALRDYLQSARDVATQTKNLFSRAFLGMEDAIVQFVQTGKLSFADLARQIEADLIRIAIRQAVVFGINSALGGTDVVRTFSGSSAGAQFGGVGGNFQFTPEQFANGGIMTAFGSVPLRKYASGGIANRPQMALFGEGSMAEAYVPLPDGRSIPVTMNGGNGSISVVVNVGAGGNDVQGANDPRSKELGNVIASAVKNQILIEKRPGGLLYA